MKITVYTDEGRQNELSALIESALPFKDKITRYELFKNYDDFLEHLSNTHCDIVIIAIDGAEGMESARAVKILKPLAPLIWLSDDNGFGPESYRVGCTYFSASPISDKTLTFALDRCISAREA